MKTLSILVNKTKDEIRLMRINEIKEDWFNRNLIN